MQINIDLVYPIGALYMSVNATNPSILFGGTWKQITDDAYLKVVTSKAGELAGTSKDHKIPIESMPKHTHSYTYPGDNYSTTNITGGTGIVPQKNPASANTGATGGGQAYYPYYLGIYVWVRTA